MNTASRPGSTSRLLTLLAFGLLSSAPVLAADWSDTYLDYRYGTAFRESYVNRQDGGAQNIAKHIIGFNHTSGYKYGINFFNVDFLMSDDKDAASCPNFQCTGQAHDVYAVYRHHLEWGKIVPSHPVKIWGVKDLAFTLGFDWQAKTDAGYNSKKRMWVWGPTVELNVPGYMNVGVYGLNESNAPCTTMPPQAVGYPASGCYSRYFYKTHVMLSSSWSIPISTWPVSYEGYANIISAKGTNEFGGPTKPEINWDSEIMVDVGALLGGPKATFKVGPEFQYWRNKYGNDHNGGAGPGAFAQTFEIRAEYHF